MAKAMDSDRGPSPEGNAIEVGPGKLLPPKVPLPDEHPNVDRLIEHHGGASQYYLNRLSAQDE